MGFSIKKITKPVEKAVKGIAHDKYVRAAVGYFTGYGEWQAIQAGYAYVRGGKDAQNYYNMATGHYARQQSRIAKEEQQRQARVLKQQQEYAYKQRKEQIDALRERVGAGGSRYRTDRQEKKLASSIWGSGNNVETLG